MDMGEAHGVTSATPVTAEAAHQVARVMAALGTASRVRILACLRQETHTVGELTDAVEMAQPAVSNQLRILRDLGLVVGIRSGRNVRYALHDPHVATLLDEALRHVEHRRAGVAEIPELASHHNETPIQGSIMSDEHTHEAPHAHEHEHDGEAHAHAHTTHEHEHVEHEHEHSHDSETHDHAHVHQADLAEVHEHDHS